MTSQISTDPHRTRQPKSSDYFSATRWTVIKRASGSDPVAAQLALSELCQTYWSPLYGYVRRCGYSPHDAEDLTQEFFARLLRLDSIANVNQRQGKFRAFLLASLKHSLADHRDYASAKRRDVRVTIALDSKDAEERYHASCATALTPDETFDRQWAVTVLQIVMQRLADEYESSGRGKVFAELKFAIAGDKSELPYRELAGRLGLTEEAVRVAIHRLRQRYRSALREELRQTVTNEDEVQEELRELRRILSR